LSQHTRKFLMAAAACALATGTVAMMQTAILASTRSEVRANRMAQSVVHSTHQSLSFITATTPISVAPPVTESMPITETPPLTVTPPDSGTGPISDTAPISGVAPITDTNPVTGTDPISATEPISDSQPVFGPAPGGNLPASAAIHLPLIHTDAWLYVPWVVTYSPFLNEHPAHGSVRQSLNAYLTWEMRNPQPGTRYTVLLEAGDTTPDVVIADSLEKTSLDPATYEIDTVYYWQVIATTEAGRVDKSPIWSFRTDYFPEIPELDAMVTVPAGEFRMGCDPANPGIDSCRRNEMPLHPVYLETFAIDKYEVTNKEYRACYEAGACNPPRKFGTHRDISYFDNSEYDYYPVLFTSNYDARAFCAWKGKRLPTEAEWEKAARGVIDTRPWPWGNEPFDCTRANTHDCTGNPARVDSFVRGQSPYGAVGMAGNVHEWVQDFYLDDYYAWSPYYNPLNTQSQANPYYSARGGDYRPRWWYARTSNRNAGHHGDTGGSDDRPLYRSFRVGIRCARSGSAAPAAEGTALPQDASVP